MSKKFSKSSSVKLLTTNPNLGWGFRVSDDKSKEKFRLYFFKSSVRHESLIHHGNKATKEVVTTHRTMPESCELVHQVANKTTNKTISANFVLLQNA